MRIRTTAVVTSLLLGGLLAPGLVGSALADPPPVNEVNLPPVTQVPAVLLGAVQDAGGTLVGDAKAVLTGGGFSAGLSGATQASVTALVTTLAGVPATEQQAFSAALTGASAEAQSAVASALVGVDTATQQSVLTALGTVDTATGQALTATIAAVGDAATSGALLQTLAAGTPESSKAILQALAALPDKADQVALVKAIASVTTEARAGFASVAAFLGSEGTASLAKALGNEAKRGQILNLINSAKGLTADLGALGHDAKKATKAIADLAATLASGKPTGSAGGTTSQFKANDDGSVTLVLDGLEPDSDAGVMVIPGDAPTTASSLGALHLVAFHAASTGGATTAKADSSGKATLTIPAKTLGASTPAQAQAALQGGGLSILATGKGGAPLAFARPGAAASFSSPSSAAQSKTWSSALIGGLIAAVVLLIGLITLAARGRRKPKVSTVSK